MKPRWHKLEIFQENPSNFGTNIPYLFSQSLWSNYQLDFVGNWSNSINIKAESFDEVLLLNPKLIELAQEVYVLIKHLLEIEVARMGDNYLEDI